LELSVGGEAEACLAEKKKLALLAPVKAPY